MHFHLGSLRALNSILFDPASSATGRTAFLKLRFWRTKPVTNQCLSPRMLWIRLNSFRVLTSRHVIYGMTDNICTRPPLHTAWDVLLCCMWIMWQQVLWGVLQVTVTNQRLVILHTQTEQKGRPFSNHSENVNVFKCFFSLSFFKAEVVDVQYGSAEDLRRVQDVMKNMSNKIALMKLGQAPLIYKVYSHFLMYISAHFSYFWYCWEQYMYK